jgi:hypothetical protein
MYCSLCETKNPEDANFCAKCGKQVARTSEAAATPTKHLFIRSWLDMIFFDG